MKPLVEEKLKLLDGVPGCYLMKNENNEVIYVGKAKNLINRVTQYFTRPHEGKTQKMVNDVCDFDFISVASEKEAFLLEINLIHKYMPKYNILLKDDKTYPYIAIDKKDHPFLKIARSTKDKKCEYFGPYPNSSSAYETINLLNRLFPLRKCKTLPKKTCLYYELGQCLGPCVNKVNIKDYEESLKQIRSFMNGNISEVKANLVKKMKEASERLEFETANEYKKSIESIDYITKKQSIISNDKIDKDVFSFHVSNDYIAFATLVIRSGLLISCISEVLPLYGSVEDALASYILQFYEKYQAPKEIVVPNFEDIEILQDLLEGKLIVPKRGINVELIDMGVKNAIKAMEKHIMMNVREDQDLNNVLEDLAKRINVKSTKTIELIDNSHINGDANVSAVVVFVNGIANKKMYRKYQVSDENKGNDFGAMKEVMYRRYYRKLSEKQAYSDLILVDGGVAQIHAAKEALNELMINVPIYGLVKDNKHTTRAIVDENNNEIDISDNKALFFLLTRMQDEVHRFVIDYHRYKKSKSMTSSILDDVKGLGDKRKSSLIAAFGSIDKIKEASIDELSQFVPRSVANELKSKL